MTMALETLQAASTITQESSPNPDLKDWANGIPTNRTFMHNNQQTYLMLLTDADEWEVFNDH